MLKRTADVVWEAFEAHGQKSNAFANSYGNGEETRVQDMTQDVIHKGFNK